MAYTPTEWKTGDIITAAKLNKAEEGIAANDAAIAALPAGLQLYGPYYAMGTQTIAAGYKGSVTLTTLEDAEGASVNYPAADAILFVQNVSVSLGNPNTPAAIKDFYMPYTYDGTWQDGVVAVDNTSDSEETASASIAFYSTLEFPQES